jgi:hypothetical protein
MRPSVDTLIRKGFVMAAHSIRSIVARFVVITGLAASLLAGSYALVHPSQASAAKSYCGDDPGYWYREAQYYWSIAYGYRLVGNYVLANYYYGLGDRAYDIYQNC